MNTPMRLARAHTIDDLHRMALRRLPRMVGDFLDGGAEAEVTRRRNEQAFEDLVFAPRYLVDVSTRDLATTVLGTELTMPLALAPTGLPALAHPDGEIAAARAAGAHGTAFSVSTFSSYTIEEIAAVATGPLWFQVYLWKDRGITRDLIDRARAAGYTAVILTADVPVMGQRERDLRNGMKVPLRIGPRAVADVARHPRWLYGLARHGTPTYVNMRGVAGAQGDRATSIIAYANLQLLDPTQTWADVEWLRETWEGPLAVKGLLHPDDGIRAVQAGSDAVLVSNHGGRQLDGGPAAIEALTRMVDAIGSDAEVLLDGGVRRGADVVKALALGARACLIGRPFWWGLAAGGEAGVARALQIYRSEIDRVLALTGRPVSSELDASVLTGPVTLRAR